MSALTRPSEANRQKVAVEFKDAMLLGQEAERRRVAQELHDDISQRLMLVGLELNEVEQRVRTEGSLETEEKLRTVRRRVESIALDIYRISHNLHPTTLVHLGLVSAFRALCQDFSAQTHLGVEFTSDIASPLPSHDVEIGLYRVTQECLSNVARHSGSREAHVALIERSGVLYLTIADRGVGFDIDERASMSGLGLVSIRERARRLGGDLRITSVRGHGTTVTVRVPLDVVVSTLEKEKR
jgi:signal transduction histidine kinase